VLERHWLSYGPIAAYLPEAGWTKRLAKEIGAQASALLTHDLETALNTPVCAVWRTIDRSDETVGKLGLAVDHRAHERLNNCIEGSHWPTWERERKLGKFKSHRQAQRFLLRVITPTSSSAFAAINSPQSHTAMPRGHLQLWAN